MKWEWGDTLKPLYYDLIVADPPWFFEAWTLDGHNSKGAGGQYELMRLEDIMRLRVGDLASGDCLLLLWTTGWAIAEGQAQRVARAWGFKPVTEIVWRKTTPSGKTRYGTGYRVRSCHEPILVCTTGNPEHAAIPSEFPGIAREHSRKPDEFYKLLDRYCPNLTRRADLFSRETRAGWHGWGKEHGIFDPRLTDAAESQHASKITPASVMLKPQEMPRATHAAASLGGSTVGLFDVITT